MKKHLVQVKCIKERKGIEGGGKFGNYYWLDLDSICIMEGKEYGDIYQEKDGEFYFMGFFEKRRFI